jgi:nicotinamidase-related amidase
MPTFSLSKPTKRALLAGTAALAVSGAIAVALAGSAATAAPSIRATAPTGHHDSAGLPKPVPVSVDPATTAYLVLDDTTAVCAPNPSCVATLPAAASFLGEARTAGALVVYSKTVNPSDQILPQVAPQPTDRVVAAKADKFFNTDLDQVLSSHGIKTLLLVGTKSNGAILYTAYEANARGYTVVVAEDAVSADSPYIMHYSLFQFLNAPGFPNAANTPLLANAVTLSRTKLISFQPAG